MKTVFLMIVFVASAVVAQAEITIDLVPVGNTGNSGEWSGESYGGYGPDRICGAVGYTYNIGKYEVTAAQYTAFLNSVGGVDTYSLYNTSMWRTDYGSGISRSGGGTVEDPYTYTVDSAFVNRPVNYVSYWNACRFANWLHNGQPTGSQGAGTTETGAYTLTADGMSNNTIVRNADWKWAVTSEDEWYKAAYHKNDGNTANYFAYPTSSNSAPGQDMTDASGNNANYITSPYVYPIDSGKYTTLVGQFQNSASPYGTFDQGGNVWEWNESVLNDSSRGLRGGSFFDGASYLASSDREAWDPANGRRWYGFRVASVADVPEPGSITLLVCGAIAGLICWRRRK